jgi:hypothetical protein
VCVALPAWAQEAAVAGRVVFVAGPAQVQGADGVRRPVAMGAVVRQGEQILTGVDAYVHLSMVDNAFVALRPDSRLAIELYEYDPAQPSASRIRMQLHGGNTRTVSGKGGQAARHNYRFNTPVAAIGLRGTDYTVSYASEATRVSVARGAVSVSPLGEGCLAAALGPCRTSATRELPATLSHAYVEVSAQARVPVLVRPEQDPQGGRQQNPQTRPVEPRSEADDSLDLPTTKQVAGQISSDRVVATLPDKAFHLIWGRWSTYAAGPGAPAVTQLLSPGREIVVSNEVFGLLRAPGPGFTLPAQGSVSFNLGASEAYTLQGGALAAAKVKEGSLSLDFAQRTFSTALAVQHGATTEQLQAHGGVQFQGFLVPDPYRSTMTINGAVATGGNEAAYLFEKRLANGGGLLGAVRWVR